ncbi:hypothetical protein JD844_027569 [Phrynosoma platyrhinos]|uniref:Uncharacterized protein n=1 Tax=Phrynosoma platyrhinos TaxID=52577 RepID=A0ABQ7SGN4_PHRPL|nr:hypothetical protein JD844_027569 [Phrynosoma platyrhinos]
MIVILKLAFCLRAIEVKIFGETTAGTHEEKKVGPGVLQAIQNYVMKSVTYLCVLKVMPKILTINILTKALMIIIAAIQMKEHSSYLSF